MIHLISVMAVGQSLKPSAKEYLFKILYNKALLIKSSGLFCVLKSILLPKNLDMGENRTENFVYFPNFSPTYLNRLCTFFPLCFKSGEKIKIDQRINIPSTQIIH